MTLGGDAEMHQISWHRTDSNGPGAKTGGKMGRKPQAAINISCSFLVKSHFVFTYVLTYTVINFELAFNIW